MIPRIIHQIYMQGWDAIPDEVKANIAAFQKRNPGWEYRFYNETSGRQFIADRLPEYLAAYDRIEQRYFAARSDFLRYCVCYVDGGFYFDLKSVAARPLDEILGPDDEFVLSQWPFVHESSQHRELRHIAGYEYVVFFLAASKKNPLLRAVLDHVARNVLQYRLRDGVGRPGVLRVTGPIAYSLAIEANRGRHPHRIARMQEDLHLEPSMYGDHFSHWSRFGRHYSELCLPVARLDPIRTMISVIFHGMLFPVIARVRHKGSRVRMRLEKYLGNLAG